MRDHELEDRTLVEHYAWAGSHWTGDVVWAGGVAVLCVLLGLVLLVGVLGVLAAALGVGLYYPSTRHWLWPAVAAGLILAGLVVWRVAVWIGAGLRSAPGKRETVPIEVAESYLDGRPKRILAKHRKEDGGEVIFEYGCGPRGEVRHQVRPGGKICQCVIGGNTVGIYAHEVTGEELRRSRLSKYWQWLAHLPLIPDEAKNVELLAYASADVPRPDFTYRVYLRYRVGGAEVPVQSDLREQFLQGEREIEPGWPVSQRDASATPVGLSKAIGHGVQFREVRKVADGGEVVYLFGEGEIRNLA